MPNVILVKEQSQRRTEKRALFIADVAVLPNEIEEGLTEQVTPETVILFVGRRPSDQPTAEMLKVLEGVTVLRTDERGTITFVMYAAHVNLETQK